MCKFRLGSGRNFGSVLGSAGFGRFGSANILRNFLQSISCSLTIYGYNADRLCSSLRQILFSVTAQCHNTVVHISTITFYVVKLSACCGERFYIHALILYIALAKLYMLRLRFLETWHLMLLIAAIVLSALIN